MTLPEVEQIPGDMFTLASAVHILCTNELRGTFSAMAGAVCENADP